MSPRVARSSRPWALLRNPVGIVGQTGDSKTIPFPGANHCSASPLESPENPRIPTGFRLSSPAQRLPWVTVARHHQPQRGLRQCNVTQGGSFLATLGFVAQSPWDCRTVRRFQNDSVPRPNHGSASPLESPENPRIPTGFRLPAQQRCLFGKRFF
jgi:hypothetical protein